MHLFFPTIPEPLKQYTLLKKDNPFRFPLDYLYLRVLSEKI